MSGQGLRPLAVWHRHERETRVSCLPTASCARVELWRQESIVGSVFEGTVSVVGDKLHPHIKGTAFITAESDLILDARDPFCMGIRR